MGELVIVTWEDTTNIAAWQTPEEVAEWAGERGWICQNVGWLVYEDELCVVIAGRRAQDHQRHVGLIERIPRKAILEMNNYVRRFPRLRRFFRRLGDANERALRTFEAVVRRDWV